MKTKFTIHDVLMSTLVLYLVGIPIFFAFAMGLQWAKNGRGDVVAAAVYGASWPGHLFTQAGVRENAGCTAPGAWPVRVGNQSN